MPTIIDGYNLLYVAGLLGGQAGPGGLQRARLALLNFLAESLDPAEVSHTTVVFDAREPPWGMPRTLAHRGLSVRFAAQYENADALIEELIRRDSAPRRLIVVSSDHRLQRAAKHRRAEAVDSDTWYAEVVRARRQRQQATPEKPERPYVPLLAEDVNYWINQFGGEELLQQWLQQQSSAARSGGDRPAVSEPPAGETAPYGDKEVPEIDNPFPPGYGEDLEES